MTFHNFYVTNTFTHTTSLAPRKAFSSISYPFFIQFKSVNSVTDIHKHAISWSKSKTAKTLLRILRKRDNEPVKPLRKRTHPFFIAPYTEYPLVIGLSLFIILENTVQYCHEGFATNVNLGLFFFGGAALYWAFETEKLAAHAAIYTKVVQRNLIYGVGLFIISEVMIFFGLFWAFFHSSLNPATELGAVWPPQSLTVLDWFKWPLLSTLLLIYSGSGANVSYFGLKLVKLRKIFNFIKAVILTAAVSYMNETKILFSKKVNNASLENNHEFSPKLELQSILSQARGLEITFPSTEPTHKNFSYKLTQQVQFWTGVRFEIWARICYVWRLLHTTYGGLLFALSAGLLFMICQNHEYGHAVFSIADGVYSSVFYSLTGLHGLHVFAGLLLLFLMLGRFANRVFDASNNPHVGVMSAVWYWHFVDVVWVLLFFMLYAWGNAKGSHSEKEVDFTKFIFDNVKLCLFYYNLPHLRTVLAVVLFRITGFLWVIGLGTCPLG